jgi:hypothetical protein
MTKKIHPWDAEEYHVGDRFDPVSLDELLERAREAGLSYDYPFYDQQVEMVLSDLDNRVTAYSPPGERFVSVKHYNRNKGWIKGPVLKIRLRKVGE